MSGWSAKRFWTETRVQKVDGGFTVRLDGRAVKTPAKTPLIVPTLAMAERIAAEWQAQQGTVDPRTMPWTRSANAALDKVGTQFAEVASLLAAYGDTDLLCYRAGGPPELALRQARAWDPLLAWSATALDAPLKATAGVMHVAQPPDSLARLTARIGRMTAFQLTGFHDLVVISGSLVLALAVTDRRLSAEEAWRLSRLDEHWQAEVWGRDEEAEVLEAARQESFLHAERFYRFSD
ncbi:MAG: ATPase [Rhodobacter sp.]|jgi:chaperone required for assembly of F1-ATPase|nr:ATPase [Rhodobacter sp.]